MSTDIETIGQFVAHQKMDSNIELVGLDGLNYVGWVTDMLLKSKVLWQYTKVSIPSASDAQVKFVIDRKKDEIVRVITTYISREIRFYTYRIDCPHEVWKKLKPLFDKVIESQVMKIEKELISMDPHSFERIEDYLAHAKEL